MRKAVNRLFIVAIVCFFPLAIAGRMQEKTSLHKALRAYQAAIFLFSVFLICLAIYTYGKGGNFIKPMGTFY